MVYIKWGQTGEIKEFKNLDFADYFMILAEDMSNWEFGSSSMDHITAMISINWFVVI